MILKTFGQRFLAPYLEITSFKQNYLAHLTMIKRFVKYTYVLRATPVVLVNSCPKVGIKRPFWKCLPH